MRFGLEEVQQPTYSKSETNLFEQTSMVRLLVDQMEKKEAGTDET